MSSNWRRFEVLLPLQFNDLERLLLAHSPRFQWLLNKSRQSIKAGKGLSRNDFWKAVEQRQRKHVR